MELERGKGRSYFSVSSVKLYLKCPNCYALRYVHNVPQSSIPERVHFGSAVHAGLAALYSGQPYKAPFRAALLKDFEKVRLDSGAKPNWDSMFVEGYTLLSVYDQKKYFLGDVVSVEEKVKVSLRHPFTGEVIPMPMMLSMDVVLKEGIVDHKVKANAFRPGEMDDDMQKVAYWMAFEELYGREPEFFAFNQLIRRKGMPKIEPPLRFTVSPEEKASFFDTVKEVLGKIESGEFPRGSTKWHDYPTLCN